MPFELERCFAPLPRTKRGHPVVVNKDPKNEKLLYTNDYKVIIRDAENPVECDLYERHSKAASVAAYAPSGFYIASGDTSGKLHIWDTTNKEHLIKYEYAAIGGEVRDIAWTEDSKRLVIVGEGREKFAVAILWDSGSSCGSLSAHSKCVNACDIKQNRPYRVATASEDYVVGFFEGPPFKFKTTHKKHTNFVNALRYAPDGSVFITGGADGMAFVFDGKTSDPIGQLAAEDGDKAHKGGVYAIAFSPDSTKVATASADKTVKIWNVETRDLISTTVCGTTIDDQQLGAVWMKDHLVTVSLSGFFNYINPECPDTPSRIVKGHKSGIYVMAISDDRKTLFTGDFNGRVVYWDIASGNCDVIEGKGHTTQLLGMAVCQDDLVTVGMDDQIIFTSISKKVYGNVLKLDSQPRSVAVGPNGVAVAACLKEVFLFKNGNMVRKLPVEGSPDTVCAAVNTTGSEVAISYDDAIYIYNVSGDNLEHVSPVLKHGGNVTAIEYSPNGEFMVATDAAKKTTLYSTADKKVLERDMWAKHSGKITCVAFSPDSQNVMTGGLDGNLGFYNVTGGIAAVSAYRGAHAPKGVDCVAWIDNDSCVSASTDCSIKFWKKTA